MNFSLSTVINTTIAASFLICLMTLLMSSRHFMKHINISSVLFVCTLITVRLLFPYEFFFTRNVNIERLWGDLYPFLHRDFYIGNIRLEFLYLIWILWILGAFFMMKKLVMDYRQIKITAAELPPLTDSAVFSVLNHANGRYPHPVSIHLASSGQTVPPCIVGIQHPVMILPDIKLSEKEWDYIISHELAHYYNKHLHLKWLMEFLSALYFWNPLIPVLKKQMDNLMEFSADALATKSFTPLEKIEYAECLTKMSRMQHDPDRKRKCGTTFAASHSSNLTRRVHMLLEPSSAHTGKKHSFIFTFAGFLFIIISYFFILQPAFDVPQDMPNFLLSAEETYYRPNPDGSYDVICNGEYITTVTVIFDENIPIKEE